MKYIGNFRSQLVTLGVALAFSSLVTVNAADMQTGTAVVRDIEGTAKYTKGDGVFMPLRVGDKLRPGSTVQTSSGSQVDFFLGDNGPTVRMKGDTMLGFDKLTKMGTGADVMIETQLNLSDGRILGSVKKTAASSKYEVKTPNGVAGIRGTDYDIMVHRGANGIFEVTASALHGTVVFAQMINGTARSFTIGPGQTLKPGSTTPQNMTPEQSHDLTGNLPKNGPGLNEGGPGTPGTTKTPGIVDFVAPNPTATDVSSTSPIVP